MGALTYGLAGPDEIKMRQHETTKAGETVDRRKFASAEQPGWSLPPTRQYSLLRLQRSAGNRAVVRLLESGGRLQTKLKISQPSGEHEQEADIVAARVSTLSPASNPVVLRKCYACSPGAPCLACLDEEKEAIQRKESGAPSLSSTGVRLQRAPLNGESATGASAPDVSTRQDAAAAALARPLIVEDDAVELQPGQMRKSEFLAELRAAVCSTADEALRSAGQSTRGCPYIEQGFARYAGYSAPYIERGLRKYAPEAGKATSAGDYIPLVCDRVRRGVERWARTGEITEVPEELAGEMPFGAAMGAGAMIGGLLSGIGGALSGLVGSIGSAVSGLVGGIGSALSAAGNIFRKEREGGAGEAVASPYVIQSQLGEGHSLEGGVQARMSEALGQDFSRVRVHTDARAAELSESLSARAFTIGNDIAFGAGEYQPGTLIGDALIAHELAHVVQQAGAVGSTSTPHAKSESGHASLEEDADLSAVGAIVSTWDSPKGALAGLAQNAMPRLRSGLKLQRCASCSSSKKADTTPPESEKVKCVTIAANDWKNQLKEAEDATDEAQKINKMVFLAQQALCPLNLQVVAAGTNNKTQVDPKDYQPTPTINFDLHLNEKQSWPSLGGDRCEKEPTLEGCQTRLLDKNYGYNFRSGKTLYTVIGPKAFDPSTPAYMQRAASHELFLATEHTARAVKKEDKEKKVDPKQESYNAEVDAWTQDFRRFFHLLGWKGPGPGPERKDIYFGEAWNNLLFYYSKAEKEPREKALKQLVDYFKNPPSSTAEEGRKNHPTTPKDMQELFKLWMERRDQSSPLIQDLKGELKL